MVRTPHRFHKLNHLHYLSSTAVKATTVTTLCQGERLRKSYLNEHSVRAFTPPLSVLGCLSLCRAFRSCCFSGCAAACALLPAYLSCIHTCMRMVYAAKRNKFVVVGLRGASVRKNMRLDSPVLKTLRRGTVSSSTLLNVAVYFVYYTSLVQVV